jgi:hypothetical protein
VPVIPEDAIGRSADEVFEDHLRLRSQGDLETDLERNYADDVVLLCELGALKGRAAIRKSARRLGLQLPDARIPVPDQARRGGVCVPRVERAITAFSRWRMAAGATWMVIGSSVADKLSSVTRITMPAKVPSSVGVPEISPVEVLRLKPSGSVPDWRANE